MNEEQEFLASAYLDGELTDEERRIAEADPAVMAEVEQLRALQGELASPPPPSEAARESAIGAAMAEFGQLYGSPSTEPAAAASTEPVVPFRARPAMGRWLSIAAAVLVIGLLGVAVAAGLRGGDDDDSSAADEPAAEAMTEEPADEPASDEAGNDRITEQAPTAIAGAADDGADDVMAADDDSMATEEPASEAAEEEMAADEPAEEPADDMAADDMEDAADEEPMAPPSDPADILDAGVPITTEEELAAVGQLLLERLDDEGLTTPEEACPYPNMLARATLLDSLTGELVPVVIDVDLDGNLVLAIDVDSCEVRLDAALSEAP